MPKADNGKNLVLKIKLSEPKRIIPFNKLLNKNKNKRLYYGLMQ